MRESRTPGLEDCGPFPLFSSVCFPPPPNTVIPHPHPGIGGCLLLGERLLDNHFFIYFFFYGGLTLLRRGRWYPWVEEDTRCDPVSSSPSLERRSSFSLPPPFCFLISLPLETLTALLLSRTLTTFRHTSRHFGLPPVMRSVGRERSCDGSSPLPFLHPLLLSSFSFRSFG